MQDAAIRKLHRGWRVIMIDLVVLRPCKFVGRLSNKPKRIVVPHKEAVNFCGLRISGRPHQHNAAGLFANDTNSPPGSLTR